MRIALVQFRIAHGCPQQNLARVRDEITGAAASGADLVVLPELWSTGYDLEHAASHAAGTPAVLESLADTARRAGVCVAGSVLEAEDGAVLNSLVVIDDRGATCGRYRKVHLFGLMDEPSHLAAGDGLRITEVAGARIGLAICYDLRFPEMFRRYALEGAEVLLLPAEWPAARESHWRTLLPARAVENQAFVVACNACGETGGVFFAGHSGVWSPWGDPVVEGGSSERTILCDLDLAQVAEARRKMSVLTDVRPDLYGAIR